MPRDDGGGISDAKTGPRRGRTLRIKVHQCSDKPLLLAGNGQTTREGCLSCATLSADECDCEHG